MPSNADAAAPSSERSPLDTEPSVITTKRSVGKKTPRVKVVVGDDDDEDADKVRGQDPPPAVDVEPPFEDNSPLDAEADAAVTMCEVERTGPGDGPGWQGRNFNGYQVSYGRVGQFPRTQDIFERIQNIVGGGEYKFLTKGKRPVYKKLPGSPLPLPAETQQAAAGVQSPFDHGFQGDGGYAGQGEPFDQMDPTFGIPADEAARQGSGLNGWFMNAALNTWQFFVNGQPSMPPRGSRPPVGPGFNPGAYDHGKNPEVEELREAIKALVEQRTNPMQDYLQMLQEQRVQEREERREREEADRQRREDERERERQRREDEKEERRALVDRDREERRERLQKESEDRKEAARLANESAKIQSEAMKSVSQLQAETMKANANASVEAAKQMAQLQSESSKQLVTILMTKTEDGGIDKMFDRFAKWQGMVGGDKSEAERILGLVPQIVDSTIPAMANAWQTVRGGGTQSVPQQPGEPPQGASEDERVVDVLDIANQLLSAGKTPQSVIDAMAVACLATKTPFERVRKAITLVKTVNAELLVKELDKRVQGLAQDHPYVQKVRSFQGMILNARGKAAILSVVDALEGRAPAPQLPAAPPAASTPPAPPPAGQGK